MRKISKQFKRLAILALGLSIALAGVLGIVHITQNDDNRYDEAYAVNFNSVSINASGLVSWNVTADHSGRRIRYIRIYVNGARVATPYSPNARNANRSHAGTFQLDVNSLNLGANAIRVWARESFVSTVTATVWNTPNRDRYTNLTFNRTATLATPSNVRMSGNTLMWNSVANANGYRVYRGGVHIQT
ncbi:MAG: hypothetical protein FWB72_07195, partial [Firmicutes bacterium]|nr:hypothetical protein [Bacillota bacterium]